MRSSILVGCLLFALSELHAAPIIFEHGDWSIGCDNVGHCEAVGHQRESDEHIIAMSIARDAGPSARLRVQLVIQPEDEATSPAEVTVQVGRNRLASVPIDEDLPSSQIAALLPWMLNNQDLLATSGKQSWRLSLSGLKAVLLKMDEVQGRLDTPGALVRKGSKPESAVPKAAPAPQLVAQPIPSTTPADSKQLPQMLKAMPEGDCEPGLEADLTRLSSTKLLVMSAADVN